MPDADEIKNYYDTVDYASEHEWDKRGLQRHYERLYKRVVRTRQPTVLDVACGSGEWLAVCRDRGASIAGIDISEKAIERCKQYLVDGRFFAQPAEKLPFDDGEFDLVTCLGSLEHFLDPVASLTEMVRVASDAATFVLLVPNADFLTRRIGLFRGTDQVAAREVVRTIDEWESIFQESGLTVEERWRDLHVLNSGWIRQGPKWMWPVRVVQALILAIWPIRWQYQIYFRCRT